MYIVQVASELAPIAKIGGLADVMMGLSRELKWKGHEVAIFLPKFDCLEKKYLTFKHEPAQPVTTYFQGQWYAGGMEQAKLNGDLTITFYDSHHPKKFFHRGCIYGESDDNDRFLHFSRAVVDFLHAQERVPDIIHVHDWETAIIACLIREPEFRAHFAKTKTVLTIHNFDYQGRCSPHNLDDIGLHSHECMTAEQFLDPITKDGNLLKGGIMYADHVVTVSPTYAKEVLTPQGGKGLDQVLRACSNKFVGILNGLDYSYWNPEIDRFIAHHYTHKDTEPKRRNKQATLHEFGMQYRQDKPLLVAIARLVPQKGIQTLKALFAQAESLGIQYFLLGTAPDPRVHEDFAQIAHAYADHPDIRCVLRTEESLAHKLYAASDMLLVPSEFEPCGLTQLIAMKYGSVPIVRRTGGLADTVFDMGDNNVQNGFCFNSMQSSEAFHAIQRAVEIFVHDQKKWHTLMKQGMEYDFSWNKPTDSYIALYEHHS